MALQEILGICWMKQNKLKEVQEREAMQLADPTREGPVSMRSVEMKKTVDFMCKTCTKNE